MIPLALAVPAVALVAVTTKRGRRFLAGHPMDGDRRTNATFTRAPTRALHPTADRSWWHWRPGWHRGGIRAASLALVTALAYGLLVALTATLVSLGLVLAALLALAGWYLQRGARSWLRACTWDRERPWRSAWSALTLPLRHHLYYRRPLRAALAAPAALGGPPASIRVPLDRRGVTIGLTAAQLADTARHEAVKAIAAATLALQAPAPGQRLHGRKPQLTLTASDPPPPCTWDDLAPAITAQARNALTFGLGKGGTIVRASYGDAPHLGIPGGTGGGKSNLTALLVLQELIRGTLMFILDPKGDSHLWALGLPNVIYCVKPEEIHLALDWLAGERDRRADLSRCSAMGTGIDRSKPGIRIGAVIEELNIGMPRIKAHWKLIGGKGEPRAVAGLRDLACAGRSQDMHAFLVAQMFSVESTGVRDSTVRSQCGIKCMTRWDERSWEMAVGKGVPMPAPVSTKGQMQLVTSGAPQVVQVPYLHLDDKDHPAVHEKAVGWARELAVSGTVAAIPSGPQGVPAELWPSGVLCPNPVPIAGQAGSDIGHRTDPAMTINEAMTAGIFPGRSRDAAAKAVQRAQITPLDGPARRGREARYHPDDLRKAAGGDE